MSATNKRQVYIPPGFAHGFCALTGEALFSYKCTEFYSAPDEVGIVWDDPDIGIDWPIESPILSDKDRSSPRLKDVSLDRLPRHG